MKMEIKIIPTDMNEAQKILAALTNNGLNVTSVTEKVGEVSVTTCIEPEPETGGEPAVNAPEVEVAPYEQAAELTLDSLTLGTERDSAQRLWCAEINSSNKSTKADNTFKRKPKIDDAYYDQVIVLLDAEAAEHRASLTSTVEEMEGEPVGGEQISGETADGKTVPPVTEPTPAPAPAPEPQREIVAYEYQGNQYTKEQLLSFPGWSEPLIAQHCEPVYAEPAEAPAPVVTGDVDRESVRKQMMSVTNKGLAKIVRDVVTQITPEGTPNMNDIPDSELPRFAAILNKAEANAEALKAGTMVVEQLLNG